MRLRPAIVLACTLLAAAGSASAQSDPRVLAAVRLAQDGRVDSARSALATLETSVGPADSTFAQVLYAQGLVAPTVDDARQRLQRVVTEYPLSSWADDAVVRLGQLEYANGDPAAAARQLEKFHGDYAASPLFPIAAVWAGRALLRAQDSLAGCRWVSEGLGRVGRDAATRRELAALATTCAGKAVAVRDSARPTVAPADSVVATPSPATSAPPAPAVVTVPAPASTAAPAWRLQIIAAGTPAEADAALLRARRAGFDAIVVREGNYHKVRIGSYASRAEASADAARVKAKLGVAPFVVRDP